MERLLGFDLQLLQDALITGVNIFILFFALSYLLFNPAKELLSKRKLLIAGQLEGAVKEQEDARALKLQYENKLKHIQKEADLILNHARDMAIERQTKMIKEAKDEAQAIMDRASHEILLEKKKAMEEMKQEVVNIAAVMACKSVAELLGNGLSQDLIEESVREMGEYSWQS